MAKQDSEGRAIGLEMGKKLFQLAQKRMDDFVLKAEVGLIDVAWQQKQQETEAVKELENQKASRLGNLTRALRQLTEGEDESL